VLQECLQPWEFLVRTVSRTALEIRLTVLPSAEGLETIEVVEENAPLQVKQTFELLPALKLTLTVDSAAGYPGEKAPRIARAPFQQPFRVET